MVKVSKDLMDGGPLLLISTFPSLAVIAFGEVEIYRFFICHVTSCGVATQSQGHVTLLVVSLSLTHQSAKCAGHTSCGSGDMIYSHL